MKYLSKEHRWAARSIPITRTGKVIPLDKPSYVGFVVNGDYHAAIFNNSQEYATYYINMVEVPPQLSRW